ncbi:hypothetical protein O3M35_009565 [Rhynocoris fuscipes]|uniref:Uncharacterized protein n=1 Tax=Rhynocoris fuscipes TaxID=488301 RepID=A0AAW1D4P2_9HEMI
MMKEKLREPYTSIKLAIKRWEEKHKKTDITDAIVINFSGQWFPIIKMDEDLKKLKSCEALIMNSNKIERFEALDKLPHLTYLSMELNQIKSLEGLEPLKFTLKVLLLGCNLLQSLKGVENFPYLEIFHIPNNLISHWCEFDRLLFCERLINVSMIGNKFNATLPKDVWIFLALRRNPRLRIIDNTYVTDEYLKDDYQYTLLERPSDKITVKSSDMDLSISSLELSNISEYFCDEYPSRELSSTELMDESSDEWADKF